MFLKYGADTKPQKKIIIVTGSPVNDERQNLQNSKVIAKQYLTQYLFWLMLGGSPFVYQEKRGFYGS